MKLILQPKKSSLCGQCCVAMLMDISLEEAIKLVGHSGVSSNEDILSVLETKYPGIYSRQYFGSKFKDGIYLCKHRNPKNIKQEHWTISNSGVIMDPSGRPEKDLWPTYRYWIV